MKTTNSITARRMAAGIDHNINLALALAVCLLAGTGLAGAQGVPSGAPGGTIGPEAPAVASGNTNTVGAEVAANAAGTTEAAAEETNSPVARIVADLERLKLRIGTAATVMSNAVASTPAVQAARVRKLADEISDVATQSLGDGGQIVKQAEALYVKFNEAVAEAQKRSSDTNIRPATRAGYEDMLRGLKGELGRLVDAKSSIAQLRTELLRQAEGLRQSADLIGFAEHRDKLMAASQEFRAALGEVAKFTEKVSLMIQGVVKNLSPVPVS